MFHADGTKASQEHDAEGDEVEVAAPSGILARVRVVMRQGEELGRVRARLGHAKVCEENEGDEVEGEACIALLAAISADSSSTRATHIRR